MANQVITNDGRRAVRDFLVGEVADLAVGTDGTEPSPTDSALGNRVIAKASSDTADDVGSSKHTVRLDTTEANNQSIEELGSLDSSDVLLSRLIFSPIDKTSDFEIEFRLKKTARNP